MAGVCRDERSAQALPRFGGNPPVVRARGHFQPADLRPAQGGERFEHALESLRHGSATFARSRGHGHEAVGHVAAARTCLGLGAGVPPRPCSLRCVSLGSEDGREQPSERRFGRAFVRPFKGFRHSRAAVIDVALPCRQLGLCRKQRVAVLSAAEPAVHRSRQAEVELRRVERPSASLEARPIQMEPDGRPTGRLPLEAFARRPVGLLPAAQIQERMRGAAKQQRAIGRRQPEPARLREPFPGDFERLFRPAEDVEQDGQAGVPETQALDAVDRLRDRERGSE